MSPSSSPPTPQFISLGGHRHAWFDFGGPGGAPVILFVHGTGLHSMTWLTHARALSRDFRCIGFDHRGHGDSEGNRESYDWGAMADDLAAFVRAAGLDRPRCAGHSMGGATVAIAAGRNPGLFGPSVLIDPIILPPNIYGVPITHEQQPMAAKTIKRRYEWASHAEMIATYRAKMPFRTWRPAELKNYVVHGTEPAPGGGVRLKCPPRAEADCYLGGHETSPWPLLGAIDAPVLLLRGDATDTGRVVDLPKIASLIPRAEIREIPGTHFLPMDNPEGVVREIDSFLTRARGGS